ncbi:hypothetical protein K490DRAFT_69529 [Saccharata proteae CBS 121410]|uniref:Calcium channel YVC1-like C-terminal transmembrane domain-containing protein n=1 Tax=Saccharata proteae CBS 121410 TaxID=1314787 RepID=A0A9P4HMW8_9PEZI|nr:hypothetical protein K490DRAFT_69529 [Saccharata proteae CBS 121410]
MPQAQNGSSKPKWLLSSAPRVPVIHDDDSFDEVVKKLSLFFVEAITTTQSFEELRGSPQGHNLQPLIDALVADVHHIGVVAALLALKGHFVATESDDNRGIHETRGYACEFVAWQFIIRLSEREAIDYLLWELPETAEESAPEADPEASAGRQQSNGELRHEARESTDERSPLLSRPRRRSSDSNSRGSSYFGDEHALDPGDDINVSEDLVSSLAGLNALEIAAVAGGKKFLSQQVINRIVDSIWDGSIVFWESIDSKSPKKATLYNRKYHTDPFCRLRVPRYIKTAEVIFFLAFLALYFVVLLQRKFHKVTPYEILLYIWIVGFTYDEFVEYRDAGGKFYATEFWSLWDICITLIGSLFLVIRIIGLATGNDSTIDTAFDVLSLEGVFLFPRLFSMLSLNEYFGTLIPCLREMAKSFIKFLGLVLIIYLGFLTTFTLLARGNLAFNELSGLLLRVFFGASLIGFNVADQISPFMGLPLMVVFACMTNFLLISTLTGTVSNSSHKVMEHAREEYLYVYSVYVLEASSSQRLTYFLPPLNLIPLLFLRPLRLFFSADQLRSSRVVLLKITHAPHVALIWAYERGYERVWRRHPAGRSWKLQSMGGPATPRSPFPAKRNVKPAVNSPRALAAAAEGAGRSTTGHGAPRSQEMEIVLRLSSQVDELTSVIARLQQRQDDEAATAAAVRAKAAPAAAAGAAKR